MKLARFKSLSQRCVPVWLPTCPGSQCSRCRRSRAIASMPTRWWSR